MATQIEDGIVQGDPQFMVQQDGSLHPTLDAARRRRLKLLIGEGTIDQTISAIVQNLDAIAPIVAKIKVRRG